MAIRTLAYCYWCNEEIKGVNINEVKMFWNDDCMGYPICKECLGDLKDGCVRKEDVKIKRGIEKWL